VRETFGEKRDVLGFRVLLAPQLLLALLLAPRALLVLLVLYWYY